jgi:dimethylargininase
LDFGQDSIITATAPRCYDRLAVRFTRAIVRPPASNFADGLTTVDLGLPDPERALAQHEAYCQALERCGLALTRLAADPHFPDSTFVEDTAVITTRGVVLTRPGAESRRGEVAGVRDALLAIDRSPREIMAPGTVDGGDVCEAGSHFLIGISERTNEEGARQLAGILARDGFTSSFVDIRGMPGILHLKSGLSWLGESRLHREKRLHRDGWLIAIEALADLPDVARFDPLRVPAGDEYGANCVRVNEHVLMAAGLPRVTELVRSAGDDVIPLAMSEFRKMDGGLSCLSLRC